MKAEKDFVLVGADDGHFGVKLVGEDGVKVYVPSRVANGAQIASIGDGAGDGIYEADGQTWTVSDSLAPLDTRFADYGLSPINRVLVHHALLKAGMAGKNVKIITGLPVKDYFIGGAKNDVFIDKKVRSLTEHRVVCHGGAATPAVIVEHLVVSEAVAAFFDLLLDDAGNVNPEMDALVGSGSVGIIDIGGKTTDSAVVINGGSGIDAARSGTAHLGALALNDALDIRLRTELKIDSLPVHKVDAAARSGHVTLFGRDMDVSAVVNEEKAALAAQIIGEIKRRFRDAADLERVFFVGGGSLLLKDQIADLFPHGEFVQDPQFANARGMLKIARRKFSRS